MSQISYEDWIKSKGGTVNFKEGDVVWELISIEFEHEEDATMFKLKYM